MRRIITADPLVASVLDNELSTELAHFKEQFPQHVEVFLTDRQGLNVASTNRTSDYYQGDEEWWQTAAQQGVYIGQPEYDESSKTVAINMAAAIYAENGTDVVGVLRSTVDFNTLAESLINGRFGQTGKTDHLPATTAWNLNWMKRRMAPTIWPWRRQLLTSAVFGQSEQTIC